MVTIHIFERKFGLFVTLLQFGGYTFFAFLQWLSRETKHNSLPIAYCVSIAVLQASMQGLSNLSIKYLNYPAKVCAAFPRWLRGAFLCRPPTHSRRSPYAVDRPSASSPRCGL